MLAASGGPPRLFLQMQFYAHHPLPQRIVKSTSSLSSSAAVARGKYRTWEQTTLERAIDAKRSGLSYRRSAAMYGIPTTTLHDHMSGKIDIGAKPGPKPYLNDEEEEELAGFLVQVADIGYPKTKIQVLALVQQIIESKGISATVSNGWWERFVVRHSELTLRAAVPLSLARAKATDPSVFTKYFDILEECLLQNQIFDKPSAIYNCDETGLPLNPSCGKVVTKTGRKDANFVTGGDKSQVTVLACTSAAGFSLPPFVIFDRQSLNQGMTKGEVPGTLYGLSRNGWINSELFYHWFLHHFLQYAPPTRPLILLLDGHSSHYSPATIKLAAENQVIVFVLPPNTTHIAQPLDRGCFSPLKSAWRKYCHEFRANNPGRVITRYEFNQIFSKAWFKAMTGSNITASFKATGVCPFNRHVFDHSVKTKGIQADSLAKRTGLAYIPLYSPARRSHVKPLMASTPKLSSHCEHSLSDSEVSLTIKSPQNALSLRHASFDDSWCSKAPVPLRQTTSISKFLPLPAPPSQLGTKHGKSSGCVITSRENLQLLEEKAMKKQEALRQKEERKRRIEDRKSQHTSRGKDQKTKCVFFYSILYKSCSCV